MAQLVRYEPSWMAELEREMNSLLGDVFAPPPGSRWYRALPAGTARWVPACDVFNRNGDLVVQMELPGVDPGKDVRVTVQDGVLCISGERHTRAAGDDGYYRREWRYGAFERAITLPEGVTGEDITAAYENGVLEVVAQKAVRQTEPRRIPIGGNGTKTLAAGDTTA